MSIKVHDDLRAVAGALNHAFAGMYGGNPPEFLLIVVQPIDDGTVQLNTITGIQEPGKIAQIGRHLIDMALAQGAEQELDPNSDADVKGHA